MNFQQIADKLVGRKITEYYVDQDKYPVIVLDDGTTVAIMRDDEGNGPGALWILPEEK